MESVFFLLLPRKHSHCMQNRFIKNIIFLLFLNLLVKPFWILGIDREVQNLLGDASYGTDQALSISPTSFTFCSTSASPISIAVP